MDKTVFESFEDYLEEANYPQGKKKIMQAAVDLISTRSYHGTSTLHIAERAGLSQATLFKYFKTKDARSQCGVLPPRLRCIHSGYPCEPCVHGRFHQ